MSFMLRQSLSWVNRLPFDRLRANGCFRMSWAKSKGRLTAQGERWVEAPVLSEPSTLRPAQGERLFPNVLSEVEGQAHGSRLRANGRRVMLTFYETINNNKVRIQGSEFRIRQNAAFVCHWVRIDRFSFSLIVFSLLTLLLTPVFEVKYNTLDPLSMDI